MSDHIPLRDGYSVPSEILDRLPPSDIAAEKATIGACLVMADCYAQVREIVRPDDFYNAALRVVARELFRLAERWTTPDHVLLLSELRKREPPQGYTWAEIVSDCVACGEAGNGLWFARKVKDCSVKRQARDEASNILRRVYDSNVDSETLIGELISTGERLKAGLPPAQMFDRLTSRQLDEGEFRQEYIIEHVLPVAQGGIISGRFKSLKTTVGIDLALSAATGRPFLGTFSVANPCRVGIMSAESGAATLQDTGRRVAAAKGMKLADASDLIWSTSLPRLTNPKQLDAVERFIKGSRKNKLNSYFRGEMV